VRKIVKLLAIAFLCILAATFGAYAVIKWQEKITNTAMIMGYELALWRTDSNVEVTTIPWGNLETGTNKTTEQAFSFTEKLKIKNVGDYACYIGWKLNSTLPNGITLTAEFFIIGDKWYNLPQNAFNASNFNTLKNPNDFTYPVQWILTIPNDAPRGAINFDILLLAATTISG
jgi:hypothetical protein